jgi:hypothetical protein
VATVCGEGCVSAGYDDEARQRAGSRNRDEMGNCPLSKASRVNQCSPRTHRKNTTTPTPTHSNTDSSAAP